VVSLSVKPLYGGSGIRIIPTNAHHFPRIGFDGRHSVKVCKATLYIPQKQKKIDTLSHLQRPAFVNIQQGACTQSSVDLDRTNPQSKHSPRPAPLAQCAPQSTAQRDANRRNPLRPNLPPRLRKHSNPSIPPSLPPSLHNHQLLNPPTHHRTTTKLSPSYTPTPPSTSPNPRTPPQPRGENAPARQNQRFETLTLLVRRLQPSGALGRVRGRRRSGVLRKIRI